MCGVCGVVSGRGGDLASVAATMAETLRHRGPDATGVWLDFGGRVAFGHTRLSIVDLSDAGAQPISSFDGRWTMTYNGELYNTDELRGRVPGMAWRGHSDTEVLVEHVARHGVQATLELARGMFALGIWDGSEGELWLARDRFGEKPLYHAHSEGDFLFGSELKALRAVPGFDPEIDREGLAEYFRWTYVPAPRTIYKGVAKLLPGHVLRVGDTGSIEASEPFWSPIRVASEAQVVGGDDDALDRLQDGLDRAVAGQMVSDVPLGAFLSGGVDSSAVVAAMRRVSSASVRTFTIGFTESGYDESGYAADVASRLETDHTSLMVSPEDARKVIPELPRIYDEPFADSSQIPTYLVSRMARDHVTVALSGDGGDELFGGYDRYQQVARLEALRRRMPAAVRGMAAGAVESVGVKTWERLVSTLPANFVPAGLRHRPGHRLHKLARMLAAEAGIDAYASLMSIENRGDGLVLGVEPSSLTFGEEVSAETSAFDPFERAMLVDTLTYLPGDLLTKVDRASMAVSLEVRVPFLDPDLFSLAWGLRPDQRIREGRGKWLLKELLRRSLPDELIDRPKMGFGIPVGDWLRGPLRGWADELLDPGLVVEQGLLDPEMVRRRWEDHLAGRGDLVFQVWSLLMFQAWLVSER
ncbi:MAG: asparagine synthase (glutamine-hydrolyzing) [Acidimicrobiales bacterium]|nr:asparagine synthase (glutamine-hydrolyzing) [Acidimicrobiales bacterium]